MSIHLIASNKKAFHDYEVLDRFEAGIVLQGTEVKSLRDHRVNFKDSYARVVGGEVSEEPIDFDPERRRKLLLNRREINRLFGEVTKGGLTIVPLKIYFKSGKVKVEIGLARGKRLYDKRETARRKTIEREVEAELRRR